MRVSLVFPPRAGATYVPLGIATLAPYIESRVPDAQVRLVDLNIGLWNQLAANDPEGNQLLDFVRGKSGNFLDQGLTLYFNQVWNRLRRVMTQLGQQAETFLATGIADMNLLSVLGTQTEQILSFEPELVGISVLFPEQLPFAAALARTVKQAAGEKNLHLKVVLGGATMSSLSVEDLLAAVPQIDGVVVGEGEESAAALSAGWPFEAVPGLVYVQGTVICKNSKPHTFSLKNLPAPDFSRLPMDAYFNPEPVLPVLFSRGCAWSKCRFCAHNFSFGGYRRKEVQAFVSELAGYARSLGARYFYSADEYILPQDMDAICREIMERGLKISFHVLGKPTADCTPERLAFWSSAGCRWIGWGIESGSQRLLDLVKKGTRTADIEAVMHHSAAAGISNMALMIFGLPTSTDQDLDLTLEFLGRIYPSLGGTTASAFVLFANTYFARNAHQYGLQIESPVSLFSSSGHSVRSQRLKFREIATDGSLRASRGPVEVSRWNQYRKWLGDPPLIEQLPTEHCLIHISANHGTTAASFMDSFDTEPA